MTGAKQRISHIKSVHLRRTDREATPTSQLGHRGLLLLSPGRHTLIQCMAATMTTAAEADYKRAPANVPLATDKVHQQFSAQHCAAQCTSNAQIQLTSAMASQSS